MHLSVAACVSSWTTKNGTKSEKKLTRGKPEEEKIEIWITDLKFPSMKEVQRKFPACQRVSELYWIRRGKLGISYVTQENANRENSECVALVFISLYVGLIINIFLSWWVAWEDTMASYSSSSPSSSSFASLSGISLRYSCHCCTPTQVSLSSFHSTFIHSFIPVSVAFYNWAVSIHWGRFNRTQEHPYKELYLSEQHLS